MIKKQKTNKNVLCLTWGGGLASGNGFSERKINFLNAFYETSKTGKYCLKKRFFCPQDMIGLLRSNLGIFLLRKFGVVWVYIDLPGVVIWQHIHPSTLHSY